MVMISTNYTHRNKIGILINGIHSIIKGLTTKKSSYGWSPVTKS